MIKSEMEMGLQFRVVGDWIWKLGNWIWVRGPPFSERKKRIYWSFGHAKICLKQLEEV